MKAELSYSGKPLTGIVQLPASKSISNRLLMIRKISGFEDIPLRGLSEAKDTRTLENIFTDFTSSEEIDAGDAGTVMRFMTAYLSATPGSHVIKGSSRMHERPIGNLVCVLQEMGANIQYILKSGYPPMRIEGRRLEGGKIKMDGRVSSQFASALMMVGPLMQCGLELEFMHPPVSLSYLKMTAGLMREWGVQVEVEDKRIMISQGSYKKPVDSIDVEKDWSSASYFYSVVALSNDGEIFFEGLRKESLQGDRVCSDLFSALGVETIFETGGCRIRKSGIAAPNFQADFIECPDIAQTVAVCCAGLGIPAQLRGIQTLYVKETDRVSALCGELRKLGCGVRSDGNCLYIEPRQQEAQTRFNFKTYGDHRMAMSLAPLAMKLGVVEIESPRVVEKSFPGFWREMGKIGVGIKLQ